MARARLTVTLPHDSWAGTLTRGQPTARFRVRTATVGEPTALVMEIIAPDTLPSVVAAIADAEETVAVDILDRDGDRAVCHVTTTDPGPLRAATVAGTPPEFPFLIADGTVRWAVVAPSDALSTLADRLDADGFAFEVDTVEASVEATDPLTPRQQRAASAAVAGGYYETPRRCSLGDLAAELDLAKSTVSETLRRAEGRLIAANLDGGDVA